MYLFCYSRYDPEQLERDFSRQSNILCNASSIVTFKIYNSYLIKNNFISSEKLSISA